MTLDATQVEALVDAQLTRIDDVKLADRIRLLRVPARCEQRDWDYGAAGQTHPCWIILEHRDSDTAIAYCESGFGPSDPWGRLFLEGHRSMGMDSAWFVSLEDAMRESAAWDGPNPPGYEVQ